MRQKQPVKIIDEGQAFCDTVLEYLTDNSDFLVVGELTTVTIVRCDSSVANLGFLSRILIFIYPGSNSGKSKIKKAPDPQYCVILLTLCSLKSSIRNTLGMKNLKNLKQTDIIRLKIAEVLFWVHFMES